MNVPERRTHPNEWALVDFRDNVYYPVRSFLSGGNPYDRESHVATYPVRVRFPPYTPLYLLVHSPFGLLPHVASQLAYFVLTIGLTVLLAYFALRKCGVATSVPSVLGIAALLLLSRPGHWNIVLGQTTMEFVIAVYAALHFALRSPYLSGLAFAVATMKATVALPLALLMLCLRYWKSVVVGICVAVLATVVPTIVLVNSAGGVQELAESFADTVAVFEDDQPAHPVVSASRIDAVALLSGLRGQPIAPIVQVGLFMLVIGTGCAAIRRVKRLASGREADVYCFAIAVLAILISLYQQLYSAMLLVLPLTALILDRWAPIELSTPRATRPALIILLAVPAINQLIAFRVLQYVKDIDWMWTAAISINRVALILAFILYVVWAFFIPTARAPTESEAMV
jgi:hypothetical protein